MGKQSDTLPHLFVGDLHCGSHWGLNPQAAIPDRGPYRAARYLAQSWDWILTQVPKKIGTLFLMGDLVDGRQPKAEGTGLFTTKLSDQVDYAIELLEPLAAIAENIVRVDGTPYHSGHHGAKAALDIALGVTLTGQIHDIRLANDEVLNVAHHPIGGSTLYYGTALDREGIFSTYAASEGKVNECRFIVRAHRHFYAQIETEHKVVVQTPCMQLPTPHATKGNHWRWQPSLGVLTMYPDPLEPSGYRFRPILVDPPIAKPIRLKGAA